MLESLPTSLHILLYVYIYIYIQKFCHDGNRTGSRALLVLAPKRLKNTAPAVLSPLYARNGRSGLPGCRQGARNSRSGPLESRQGAQNDRSGLAWESPKRSKWPLRPAQVAPGRSEWLQEDVSVTLLCEKYWAHGSQSGHEPNL